MLSPILKKHFAILACLVISVLHSFAQSPSISYSNSTLNLFGYKPMTTVTPVNTGGAVPPNVYSLVSTINLPTLTTQGYLGIDGPVGVAYDNSNTVNNGTLVVADMWKHRIVRINLQANTYTVLAGNGGSGYANGDGVTQAKFLYPAGVLVANNGDIYVADKENHMIRKMTLQPNGTYIVSRLAGHDYSFFLPNPGNENGTGVNAGFRDPESLAFDINGNIIVADRSNHLIRKVTTAGVVTTIAGDGSRDLLGNGRFSDNTNPLLASFYQPTDIAVASNGDIYVADRYNDRIRKIAYNNANQTYGAVTTFAGRNYGSYDGTGINASFDKPYGIDFDSNGNLYVTDGDNNKIRKITSAAVVTTIAGSGTANLSDNIGLLASFNMPLGICFDGSGSLYVSDYVGDKIRKISLTGYTISPALPSGLVFDATIGQISGTPILGSAATNYTINAYNLTGSSSTTLNITVNAVAPTLTYESPKVYGANTAITPLIPTITNGVIRNSATASPTTDYTIINTFASSVVNGAKGITKDINGNIYWGDYQGDIYKVTTAGIRSLYKSGLGYIYALSADNLGNIYVTGRYQNSNGLSYSQVKKISSAGVVTMIAGTNDVGSGYPNYNTTDPFSVHMNPYALAVSLDGIKYIAEENRIFKVDASGRFSFFAGASSASYTPAYIDGLGANAKFKMITALAVDKSGNIYVADDAKVRKITSAGSVTTIADYTSVTKVVGGVQNTVRLNGITVDFENNVYVSTSFHTIYKILPNGTSTIYAGTSNAGDLDVPNGPLNAPSALVMDEKLNLYVASNDLIKIKLVRPNGIYVNPVLPTGLNLNKYTGEISGTPTVATPATSYVFIAHNDYAFSTTTSNITIAAAPTLTTTDAANITASSVTLGGNITDNGGATMIERGVVWSTTMTPTISNNKLAQSTNVLGSYTSVISNLTAATTYYVRAYITTAIGTTYGNQKIFNTLPASLPTITPATAASLMNVTATSAELINTVTNDGGANLTARGICWSTTASPTILSNITSDVVNTGTLTSTLTNLLPNTRYYLRAYATNSVGTQYGNELVFTTNGIAPNISYPATISLLKEVPASGISPTNTGGVVGQGVYGKISLFAGAAIGNLDGVGVDAKFQEPALLAADLNNNIYVADKWAMRIRKITPNATVSTIAGNGLPLSSDNANPLSASFSMPTGIIYDPYGNLIIGDKNSSKIRKIATNGAVTTIAGSGSNYLVDGTGTTASFSQQNQIAMDIVGNIYVADQTNHAIRKITPAGVVTTLAGNGTSGSTDGTGSAARFNYPYGIAVDRAGNIFVADRSNHTIRKISPAGVVTTFAGAGVAGFADGTGTAAKFYNPHGLTLDAAGNLYVADFNNYRIRKITPSGVVSTIAGTGSFGWLQGDVPGVDYLGASSNLANITGLVFDQSGNLFLAEAPRVLKMSTVGYSISPALPSGLRLDEQGQIVGTPTSISSATNYTISATNAFGTSTSTISLEVLDAGPTGLDYTSLALVNNVRTLNATNGLSITSIAPSSTGGAISSYSISPNLPNGLTINAFTGVISGKPTAPSSLTSYTITASNAISSTIKVIDIVVVDAAPSNLIYAASTLVTSNGSPITNVSPSSAGGFVTGYSVSPNLPTGITLNTTTGVISGIPNATSPLTTYTISASNNIGTATSTIDIEITGDAPIINFSNTPYVFTKNAPIQQVAPVITTTGSASFNIGTVVFAIDPIQLPTGLTFSTSTGSITGTPTTIVAASTYTISATIGSSTNYANLTIAVNDIAPSQLTFSSPSITASVGSAINAVTPSNNGGTVTNYTISPSLPAGLSFNTNTGEISGTPTASSGSNDYVITAINSGGTVSNTITLIVNDAIPTNFTYNVNNVTYTNGTSINNISPSITGNVSSYAVSPALPNGLVLNTSTGEISGTPTSPSNATEYILTATNSGGSTTYSITIAVNDIAPTNLAFSTNNINAVNGTYLVPIAPINNGGTIVNYTITPSLPAGFLFNTTTGELSGTPAAPSPATSYTITGINTGGTISTTITIEVADAAPTGFIYSTTSLVTNLGTPINAISPTAGGGAIVSYSISPILPNGLIFNTSTGIISGTPVEPIVNTLFTIIATNAAGSTSTNIEIAVNVIAPSALSYSVSTITFTEATTISSLSPTISGGAVTAYTVIPNLPLGLTLNPLTGVISGTPSASSNFTNYIVTATNASGSTTYTLSIQVNALTVPANLTYSANTFSLTNGQAVNALTLSQTGGVATYTITPNLPNGLNFSNVTGAISGTPSGTSSLTVYTITATNNAGSASLSITIEVVTATATPTTNTRPAAVLPQALINVVDRSLLNTDSVHLKINFTAGTAPFKILISNDKNNKIDTFINKIDGAILKLKPIQENTIFKVIEVIDDSAYSRTTGFTKDTALIKVLKPLLGLNLTASNPIKQSNGSFLLKLNLLIKNIGDVLLNNVQVVANLKNVFGNGYSFNLTRVVVTSGAATINPNYTGMGEASSTGDLIVQQANYSGRNIKSLSNNTENSLFANGTSLNTNEENAVEFEISVVPNMNATPLQLQFASAGAALVQKADGTSSSQVTLASSNDATSITSHPNVTGVGTPLPTAVVFAPAAPIVSNRTFILNNQGLPTRLIDVIQSYPVGTTISWCNTIIGNVVCDTIAPAFPTSVGTYPYLVRAYHSASSLYSDTVGFTVQLVNKADLMQVQQIIGAPILQENSTYNIPITIQITNKTTQLIDSVLVTNQLRSIFPSIVDFNIVSVAVSGNLVRNLLFNGDTQSGITTVESKINGGETVTIQLVININPKGYVGSIPSITNVTAKTFAGTLSYDSSPNSNNNGTGSASTILLPELAIKVPEVFTPNRDGLNDRFVIIKPYGVRIDLEVYNRWGTKVFTRNNYQNDWDGRGDNAFSGQDLVDGGYYYTIKALNNNGTTQILKGFIIIQR